MQIDVTPIKVESFLYLESKLPDDVFEKVKGDVDYVFKNQNKFEKYNKKLAGNLEKEFDINRSKDVLDPIIRTLADECYKHFNESQEPFSWILHDLWVNYQKKHEHNPLHKHTGDLSFILWVKIPYDLEEELSLENCTNSNNPSNSLFNFIYTDVWGRISVHKLNIDKSWEGKLVMFPAFLNHMVYPFHTSDEYRISISGNLSASKSLVQNKSQQKSTGFYTPKSKKNNLITY